MASNDALLWENTIQMTSLGPNSLWTKSLSFHHKPYTTVAHVPACLVFLTATNKNSHPLTVNKTLANHRQSPVLTWSLDMHFTTQTAPLLSVFEKLCPYSSPLNHQHMHPGKHCHSGNKALFFILHPSNPHIVNCRTRAECRKKGMLIKPVSDVHY